MTGDKELEDIALLEFKHDKRPEESIQGKVIRFMYSSNNDPSAYWLQGTLNQWRNQDFFEGGQVAENFPKI